MEYSPPLPLWTTVTISISTCVSPHVPLDGHCIHKLNVYCDVILQLPMCYFQLRLIWEPFFIRMYELVLFHEPFWKRGIWPKVHPTPLFSISLSNEIPMSKLHLANLGKNIGLLSTSPHNFSLNPHHSPSLSTSATTSGGRLVSDFSCSRVYYSNVKFICCVWWWKSKTVKIYKTCRVVAVAVQNNKNL